MIHKKKKSRQRSIVQPICLVGEGGGIVSLVVKKGGVKNICCSPPSSRTNSGTALNLNCCLSPMLSLMLPKC